MTASEYAERILNWLSDKYEHYESNLDYFSSDSPIRIANGARCDLICDIMDYMVYVRDRSDRKAR